MKSSERPGDKLQRSHAKRDDAHAIATNVRPTMLSRGETKGRGRPCARLPRRGAALATGV